MSMRSFRPSGGNSRSEPAVQTDLLWAGAVVILVIAVGTLLYLAQSNLSIVLWATVVAVAAIVYSTVVSIETSRTLNAIGERAWTDVQPLRAPATRHLSESVDRVATIVWEREAALKEALQRERSYTLEVELSEMSLRDAHQRLAEMNAELEAFTYSASHDIAVPLKTIEAFAQLLAESTDLSDEQLDYTARIASTAARLRNLITDLLVMSKMSSAPSSATSELVDFNSMVLDIEGEIVTALGLGVNVSIEGSLPSVLAPSARIRPILQNVIQNGLKYNDSERPLVIVSGFRDANQVIIQIADNGIGVPLPKAEDMFGLFARLESNLDTPGSGAGLAIARRAARSLGGDLWLETSGPEGSIFMLALPDQIDAGPAVKPAPARVEI
jgi:signal transduction histidine kinase